MVRFLTLSAAMIFAANAQAQGGVAVFRGIVLRDSSRTPLEGVEVAVEGIGATRSSANGVFVFVAIPPGSYSVRFRQVGFAPMNGSVRILAGDTIDLTFYLAPTRTDLPSVRVVGEDTRRNIGLAEFERRRAAGPGKFLSTEDFKGRANATLTSVLRSNVPGVILDPLPNGKVPAASRRAIQTGFQPSAPGQAVPKCYMQVFVDGQRPCRPGFGQLNDPPNMDDFLVADILAVEMYRGVAETPLEFGGSTANCGTIVIWAGRKP